MDEKDSPILDVELSLHDVQNLSDSKALSAFFAHLGYNTNAQVRQSPANLGISAEGILRSIKNIELIADQDGLFQVYLFELTSVTVGNTLALGKAFRNRAGNYLLVLTSDYERLDFVLLEKCLPSGNGSGMGAGQKQVSIRPRVLTIERRKPNRIHLRVIRRFTWTESDPFAQYDKLLSAYTVAEWSEEFFNNRALFSDYYLLKRLPGFSAWAEEPKPAYLRLLELYRGAASRFANTGKDLLKKELLEPVFEELGFRAIASKNTGKNITEPDYRLFPLSKKGAAAGGSSPLALGLVYPWGRLLDSKDYERDKENPDENPSAIVVSLLDKGESPWVVVTNGKLWRLYAQAAHSRATNYYEVDVEEILAQAGPYIADPAESFRYFWLFLSNPAPDDESPEAKAAEFLNTTKVPDRFLAQALNLLTRDVDPKRHDLVFIDYKSLGVRQLGSIYEGLLEFKLRISDRKLAIVKEKDHEIYKAFRNLDASEG